MDNLVNRVVPTMLFWMLAGLALGIALAHPESPDNGKFPFLTVVAWIVAFMVTMRVWRSDKTSSKAKRVGKSKRDSAQPDDMRLALLLDLLEPDERIILKQRLVNDLSADGEALPLADLLEGDQRHYSI
jgi:hypothetical protein